MSDTNSSNISISIDDFPDNVALYRYVDDAIIFLDLNQNAQELESIDKKTIVGKKLLDIFPSAQEMGIYDLLIKVHQTGEPEELEMKFYQDERISGWRSNSIRKLSNGDIIVFYKDLDNYKELEND